MEAPKAKDTPKPKEKIQKVEKAERRSTRSKDGAAKLEPVATVNEKKPVKEATEPAKISPEKHELTEKPKKREAKAQSKKAE